MKGHYKDYSSKKSEGKQLRELRWLYQKSQSVYQSILGWFNRADIFANSGPRQMEVYYQDFFERHFGLHHLAADAAILGTGYGLAFLYTFYDAIIQQALMQIRGNAVDLRENVEAFEERVGLEKNELANTLYSEAERLQKLSNELYPGKYIVRIKGIRYKKDGSEVQVQDADFELEDVKKPPFYWLGVNPGLRDKKFSYKYRNSYCIYQKRTSHTTSNILIYINEAGQISEFNFSESRFQIGNQPKTAQAWLDDFVSENNLTATDSNDETKSAVKRIENKAQRYTLKCLAQEVHGRRSKYHKKVVNDESISSSEKISFAQRAENLFLNNPYNWLKIKAGRIANYARQFEARKMPEYIDAAPSFIFNKLADGGEFLAKSLAWNMQFEYSLVYWTPWYISSIIWKNLGLPEGYLGKALTFGLTAAIILPFYVIKGAYKGAKFFQKASSTPYTEDEINQRKNLAFKERDKTTAVKSPRAKAQAQQEAAEARKHLIHLNYASRAYSLLRDKVRPYGSTDSSFDNEDQESIVLNQYSPPTPEDSQEEIERKLALLPKYARRLYGDPVYSGELKKEGEEEGLPFFRWLKSKGRALQEQVKKFEAQVIKIVKSPLTIPKFVLYDIPSFAIKMIPNTGRFIKYALTHRPTKTLLHYAPWLNSDNAKAKIAGVTGAVKAYIMGFFGWWALTSVLTSVAHIANAAGNISVYATFGATVAAGAMWSAYAARNARAEREADREFIRKNFADLVKLQENKKKNKLLRQQAINNYKLLKSAEAKGMLPEGCDSDEFKITNYRPEISTRQFDKDQHFKLTYNMQTGWRWKAYKMIDRVMTSFQSVIDGLWTGSLINRSLFSAGQIGFIAINSLSFLGHLTPFVREIFMIGGLVMASTWSALKFTQFLLNDQSNADRVIMREAKGNNLVIRKENAYLRGLTAAQTPLVESAQKNKPRTILREEETPLLSKNLAYQKPSRSRRAVNSLSHTSPATGAPSRIRASQRTAPTSRYKVRNCWKFFSSQPANPDTQLNVQEEREPIRMRQFSSSLSSSSSSS